jgi:hypothetical protein
MNRKSQDGPRDDDRRQVREREFGSLGWMFGPHGRRRDDRDHNDQKHDDQDHRFEHERWRRDIADRWAHDVSGSNKDW